MISPGSHELRRLRPRRARQRGSEFQKTVEPGETLTAKDAEVIQKIQEKIRDGQSTLVGQGRSADIRILNIWENPDDASSRPVPWVLKSERREMRERRLLGIDLAEECDLHECAWSISQKARTDFPDRPLAAVPRTLGLLSDADIQWLVMEYVPGHTLFERALQKWLEYYLEADYVDPEDPQAGPIHTWKKEKLLEAIVRSEVVNMLPRGFLERVQDGEEIDERMFLGIARAAREQQWRQGEDFAILTPQQYEKIANTVALWHSAGFFHRDLHPSNIMLTPDGGAAIVDFGFALYDRNRGKGLVKGVPHASESVYAPRPEWGIPGMEVMGAAMVDRIQLLSDDSVLNDLQKLIAPKKRLTSSSSPAA